MGKEYKKRHGRRRRRKRRKKSRKKKRERRSADSVPRIRRRRRYAAQPLRGPSDVLHESKTEYQMLGELARQLLGPRYPPPNKLTQQGPPFLSYDPWSQQRHSIQQEEKRRLETMRREGREQALRDAPVGEEFDELGL